MSSLRWRCRFSAVSSSTSVLIILIRVLIVLINLLRVLIILIRVLITLLRVLITLLRVLIILIRAPTNAAKDSDPDVRVTDGYC